MGLNELLCSIEDFLTALFGMLNALFGDLLGLDLVVPDLGCDEEACDC